MNCPNCSEGTLVSLSEAVATCNRCGYLLEPSAWGIKMPATPYTHPKPDWLDRMEYAIYKLLEGFKPFGS